MDRFADTAACLYILMGANVKFDWGEAEEDSYKAIRAVLSQVQDGKERVVAYGSFVLSTAQRNYCVIRRELLVIVVFMKHFRHYLFGNKFKVRTDHNRLIWLMRFKNIEG